MSDRLTRIYTRTGDAGKTGLVGGERVSKTSLQIDAIGTVDELNSVIGWLACVVEQDMTIEQITKIQHDLFNIGGELAMHNQPLLADHRVKELEQDIERMQLDLQPLKEFILPAGSEEVCRMHMVRTVCRRTERTVCAWHEQSGEVQAATSQYLNRLSDWSFVAARWLAFCSQQEEVYWKKA